MLFIYIVAVSSGDFHRVQVNWVSQQTLWRLVIKFTYWQKVNFWCWVITQLSHVLYNPATPVFCLRSWQVIKCWYTLVPEWTGEQADFYALPAPRPWEVAATPPNLFTKHTEEIRVPYTSSVQASHQSWLQSFRFEHWTGSYRDFLSLLNQNMVFPRSSLTFKAYYEGFLNYCYYFGHFISISYIFY